MNTNRKYGKSLRPLTGIRVSLTVRHPRHLEKQQNCLRPLTGIRVSLTAVLFENDEGPDYGLRPLTGIRVSLTFFTFSTSSTLSSHVSVPLRGFVFL